MVDGSLPVVGALRSFGSLVIHGTLVEVGSLPTPGALACFGSLASIGALVSYDSLYPLGAHRQIGSLAWNGTLLGDGSLGSRVAITPSVHSCLPSLSDASARSRISAHSAFHGSLAFNGAP